MIKRLPKISIITPSYNQAQYLTQTIHSVLSQNYPEIEYIICDGGSNDNSVEVIKGNEKGITYWVSEKDEGQSNAINKGFNIATGDIINWLNSDDYYENGSLYHVAEQLEERSITCYLGISRIFGGEKEYFSAGTDIYGDNLYKTIGWARIDQPETFFKKSVIDEIGHLNECLHFVMDKDLWIRYLCKYGLKSIRKDKRLLVHFRHHEQSKTISLREKFEEETQNLFYTYALKIGLDNYCKVFRSLWNVKALPLEYYPKGLSTEEWSKVFNYFILYKAFEAYAFNHYKKATDCLKFINESDLETEDRVELSKVKTRIKYLPKIIKKLFNKLK